MSKRIGITCTTVFHFIHFKRIADELKSEGFEVEYIIYTPRHINNRFERLEDVFNECSESYCSFEDVFLETKEFDAILAPYYMPGFQLLDPSIKKIRLLYGYAKDRWNYAEWNKGFDLVLNYGPYAEKRLSKYTKVVNIGHPRQRQSYKEEIVDIKGSIFRKIEQNKPVLLYCPTWADLSSLDKFVKNIEIFNENFTVVVKLHHGNVLSDNSAIWEGLKQEQNLFLYDEFTDLFDLLSHADVVLSDYSGAIFDAMLFRKPIILMDILPEDIKDTGEVNLNKMQNISLYKKENSKTGLKSLDIAVREFLPHAKDDTELKKLLEIAIKQISIPYEALLNELYSFEDHLAPKRGVKAIINELSNINYDKSQRDEEFYIIDSLKVEKFLKHNQECEFAIWGSGLSGQLLLAWLKGRKQKVSKLYDIDESKQGKEVLDTIIETPKKEGKIFITVTGKANKEIETELINMGLQEGIDFISIFRRVDEDENN